jgi:two-component system NtrC family sensor kinase
MRFTQYLGFKVFLLLLFLMVAGFVGYSYFTITLYSRHLMESVLTSASRESDLIKRSLRYSMLKNSREDVYHIINTLGHEYGVDGIGVYNKRGEIMFSSSELEKGTIVDMKAEACNMCHIEGATIESPPLEERTRVFTSAGGTRVLGLINPIENESDCYTSSCHAHSPQQKVLGVLDVKMSLADIDRQVAQGKRKLMFYGIGGVLFVAVMTAIFINKAVNVPIKKLITGTKEISVGKLGTTIDIQSSDEIGQLAESFNQMSEDLKNANDELVEWSNQFEEKLNRKTEELRKTQERMIDVEKMASLGKLAATVAHEINNPLGGILTYTKLLLKKLAKTGQFSPEETQNVERMLSTIERETMRCGRIVENLLLFAKKPDVAYAPHDLNAILERSLFLINHHLEIHNVKLEKSYWRDEERIICDGNQIEQALIALMINGIEAMPEGGTLGVQTRDGKRDTVEILVRDDGTGIKEDDLPHIFEPFYTTKKDGKGVGLGLSVVYGIVERHGGLITVDSKLGEGTVFILSIPRNPTVTGRIAFASSPANGA